MRYNQKATSGLVANNNYDVGGADEAGSAYESTKSGHGRDADSALLLCANLSLVIGPDWCWTRAGGQRQLRRRLRGRGGRRVQETWC